MLNFFVTLVNTIGVPVILIGTSKAAPILQGEFRQARRGTGLGSLIWNRMEQGSDWDLLARTMWEYQWTRETVPVSQEMLDALYQETQGIVVLAVVLYALVQDEAILNERETFSAEDIHKTAVNRMALVQPMIEAIRKNDTKRIEQYADITTIVLDQFDREHPAVDLNRMEINRKKESRENALLQMKEVILPLLLKLGVLPEKAEGLVEEAYHQVKTPDVKSVLSRTYDLYMKGEAGRKDDTEMDRDAGKDSQDLRDETESGGISQKGLIDQETW